MISLNTSYSNFIENNPSNIDFNIDKLNDHTYLTKLIFSSNKPGTKEQQLSLLLEMAIRMKDSNPYLGGVITNLCYRYNENVEKHSFIIPELYNLKKSYDVKSDITKPINARWLISSSNTLGTIALMEGNSSEAIRIFERGLKRYSISAHTPLLYMNLCMIYFQYALIKYNDGNVNHAISMFERCYYTSISAVNEIFSSRNEYALSMKVDCEKIIEIGTEAIKAKQIISKNKVLTGSRVPNIKADTKLKVNILLNRFKNKKSDWHHKVESLINEEII